MSEELLRKQNKMLKGLLKIMVEMLPRHSPDCYGLQVHPSNTREYCNCTMSETRTQIRNLN